MDKYILKNVNVLDGTKEMKLYKADILVSDKKIIKIAKEIDEKDAKIFDLEGKYITPGLINMHVHLPASGKISKKKVTNTKKLVKLLTSNKLLSEIGIAMGKKYATQELMSGVTTVRNVGGVANFDSTLKHRIESGKVVGPRILTADTAIGVVDGHMDGTVAKAAATVEEAVKLVDEFAKGGVDLIKLMITGGVLDAKEMGHPGVLRMPKEMVKACCDEAHKLGLRVAAHVESPEGIRVAIENGVDSIEHGSLVDQGLIDLMKEHDSALVCTISPALPLAVLPEEITGYGKDVMYNSKVVLNGIIKSCSECLKNGVRVGLGTDTGCPLTTHYNMWRELEYFSEMVEGGSKKLALHLATLGNANIAGIDDITGSIEEGKYADLVVLDENPLDNLRTFIKPGYVIKEGKMFKSPKVKKFDDVEKALDGIDLKHLDLSL